MDDSWVKVYTSSDFFKSEMVRQFLIENDIEAVILNKQGYPYNIGEIEVYVQPAIAPKAKELITESAI